MTIHINKPSFDRSLEKILPGHTYAYVHGDDGHKYEFPIPSHREVNIDERSSAIGIPIINEFKLTRTRASCKLVHQSELEYKQD
jgi:hypothetical protein